MEDLNSIFTNSEIPSPAAGIPEDQFTFNTIADLEIPTDLEAFDESVDADYQAMLNNASDAVNRWGMSPISNYNSPLPGPSMDQYNPRKQSSKPDISSMQGKIRMFSDIGKQAPQPKRSIIGDNTRKISDPIYSGINQTQFDRYYNHPSFAKLGFHPYRNNEEFYNENSSAWSDTGRMFGQLTKLTGTGFASSYRSWFEDDVMDLESAIEYEDAVRIGSSSRGGFAGGINNFVLNSGYTLGIIGSIALEELIMWGGTAALAAATPFTGGASGAAAVATGTAATARTLFNLGKLGKAFRRIGQSFDIGKAYHATKTMVSGLKNAERSRGFWSGIKAGDNVLGKILMPETMAAFKELKTAQKAGENLTNMAKASKKFGGFYRDARSLNFALSEGRMEGGSVYREQLANEYQIQAEKNRQDGLGETVTPEQMAMIDDRAREAAFTTTMWNAPVIYLSNQLLLGNAFGGYKRTLSQLTRDNIEGIGRRMLRKEGTVLKETIEGAGKRGAKKIKINKGAQFEAVEESFLDWKYFAKKIKSDGLRGGAKMAAAGALRYTADNFAEGIQEVYQEAVSAGIKDYYTSLALDPLAGGYDLSKGTMLANSIQAGLGQQMSSQGLETFASGFFMGGLVGGPQKLIFQGAPQLYQRAFNNEEFKAARAERDATVERVVNTLNKYGTMTAEDPTDIFGLDKLNYIMQKQLGEQMEEAQENGSVLDFVDLKDTAKLHNLFTLHETGRMEYFREQLEDYLSLTDEELAEAFPSESAKAKSGKLRESIAKQVTKLNDLQDHLAANSDKYAITADPNQYEQGSREYQEESMKYLAQRHAKYMYLFTKDSFERAGERTLEILEKLQSDPVIKDMAASDVSVLLTQEELIGEIQNLNSEINVLEEIDEDGKRTGKGKKGSIRLRAEKLRRLEKLEAIAEVLYGEEYQTPGKGPKRFDRRKVNSLAPRIISYLEELAKQKGTFVDREKIVDTIKLIVDHNHLSHRQKVYDRAMNVLNNPEYIDDLITRGKLYFANAYANKMEMFKESIKLYINKAEINTLLNKLAELGVYPDQRSVIDFGKTGDPKFLDRFFNSKGEINSVDDAKLYEKVQEAIDVYKNYASDTLKKAQEAKAKAAEAKATTQAGKDETVSDVLDKAGIEAPEAKIFNKSKNESPFIDEYLEDMYNRKRSLTLGNNKDLTMKEFLDQPLTRDIIRAYQGLKKLWYQTLAALPEQERLKRYHGDVGFKDWLALQGDNDLVADVLAESSEGKFELSMFLRDVAPPASPGVTDADSKEVKEKADRTNPKIDIIPIKRFVAETGTNVTFYKLKDKSGMDIPLDVYEAGGLTELDAEGKPTMAEAKKLRDKIVNYIPDVKPFKFDGVDGLVYGQKVKKGNQVYIILSDFDTVDKYNNLLLIKQDDFFLTTSPKARIRKADRIKPGEFVGEYELDSFSVSSASLPANVSKLQVDEFIRLSEHQNGRNTNFPENINISRARMQKIIETLTPDELNSLEVIVTPTPNAGQFLRDFKYEDRAVNPFIEQRKSRYNIAVRIPDVLMEKLKISKEQNIVDAIEAIEELGMPENNIVAYIPNANVVLKDRDGKTINPLFITEDQVSDLFNLSFTTKQQAVADIKRNAAIQVSILNSIQEKAESLQEGESIVTTLEDIGGVNFFTTPGKVLTGPNTPEISVGDLNYNKVDGVTVIFDNTIGADGKVSTRIKTDIEDARDQLNFTKRLKAEMNKQNVNLYGNAQKSRYQIIIKQPNGVYTHAPLKSQKLEDFDVSTIGEALIDRSAKTVKENLSSVEGETAKVKKADYNAEWNAELNSADGLIKVGDPIDGVQSIVPPFYIATKPGFTVELGIGRKGEVFLKIFDRNLKASVYATLSAEDVAQYKDFENKDKLIDLLFEQAKAQIESEAAAIKSGKRKGTVKSTFKAKDGKATNAKTASAKTPKQQLYLNLAKDFGLTKESLRRSFGEGVSGDYIANETVTTLEPNVRGDSKLMANIDGVELQDLTTTSAGVFTPSETFTDADGNPIPKKGASPLTTSTENTKEDPPVEEADSIDQYTKEEFQALRENDFADLSNAQRKLIAQKIADKIQLTPRETIIMSSSGAMLINAIALKLQGEKKPASSNPTKIEKQVDKSSLLEKLKELDGKILARKGEIHARGLKNDLKNSEIIKSYESDKTLNKLEKEKRDIESKLSANKVISDDLTTQDVNNIDEFTDWASGALPDFITREDILTLGDNMKSGGERVGAFVMALQNIAGRQTIGGKIYTGPSSKYAYHEAFHAVFRLLLTEEQQNQYYSLAKKEVLAKLRKEGKTLDQAIEGLRSQDISKYRNWSKKRLENEYLEEYMADEFEVFKQNPTKTKTTSFIKSLFNKILEWVRSVLSNFRRSDLQILYSDISAGKFKNAKVVSNPFTDQASEGITIDASKLITYQQEILEDGRKINRRISSSITDGIISAISARVVKLEMENTDPNFNVVDAVVESVDAFKNLYDVDNAQYSDVTVVQLEQLSKLQSAFTKYQNDFIDAVVDNLALYDIQLERQEDDNSSVENEYGLRSTSQYDKDASQTGGFKSLPTFIRKYIGTTAFTAKDIFNNSKVIINKKTNSGEIVEVEEDIVIPVDFGAAYSGFLKAASGSTDPVIILQKLYTFAQSNPQTKAVQEKLFADLGLTWEGQVKEGMIPGVTANNSLFQAMLKGFENFKIDYLFFHTVTGESKGDGAVVKSYLASNRDDAHTQINKWESAYISANQKLKGNPQLREQLVDELSVLERRLNPDEVNKGMSDEKLATEAQEMSAVLRKSLGISLHPNYIKYSIASQFDELTKDQRLLVDQNNEIPAIPYKAIMQLKANFEKDQPLYNEEGVAGRLRTMAIANANFDESVGASVFRNAEGELVYAHQLPTFHLKAVAALNDVANEGQALENLIKDDPYLATNFLLNSPAFKQMSADGMLKITRIAGSKTSKSLNVDTDGGVEEQYDRNASGVNYGDFNPKEFTVSLLSAYIAGVNNKSAQVQEVTDADDVAHALAPVLLRVIEASNTGDMIQLPVIKAVVEDQAGDSVLSDEAVQAYIDNITNEFERIKKELNPDTATYNNETDQGTLYAGYNADKTGQKFDENGRAFRFHNNSLIMKPGKVSKIQTELKKFKANEVVADRIREGNQKIFILNDRAAKYSRMNLENQTLKVAVSANKQVEKKTKGKKTRTVFEQVKGDELTLHNIKSRGKKKITNFNIENLTEKFGGAISENQTETHTKSVLLGDKTFWVESKNMEDFLKGRKAFYLYEIVEEDITEKSDAELRQDLEEALEADNFERAAEIRDKLKFDGLNFEEELIKELKKNNQEEDPTKRANFTINDALKNMGETMQTLRKFVSSRVDEVFTDWQNEQINSKFSGGELPSFLDSGIKKTKGMSGKSADIARTNRLLNLTENQTHNLKQIFVSNWINTIAINEVLLGDQALTLKNAVDAVKRAKMQNAAYYSAASRISAPELGVKNPLQEISMFAVTDPIAESLYTGEEIERSDAQNWMTVKAFRYTFFGFGKLSKKQAKLLDKVEAGEQVTMDEIFGAAGAAKKQEMINSKKFVYGDGKVFDKFSVVALSKALTSIQDANGNWIARPGREPLHNMRVKLEQYEQTQLEQGIETVAMVAPLSALKMAKYNIQAIDSMVSNGDQITQSVSEDASKTNYMDRTMSYKSSGELNYLTDSNVMKLDANFMGLQVINPSNKLKITDPTQIKTLITGEQNDAQEVSIFNPTTGEMEETTVGKVRAAYNQAISDRLEQKYLDKRNLIFKLDPDYAMDQLHKSIREDAITPDLVAFLQYAKTSLLTAQSPSELLELFSFNPETGEANYELDSPISIAKFKQLFLAYFSKSVMAEKLPGTSAALLSDYGFSQFRKVYSMETLNGKPYLDRQEIIRNDDFVQNYSTSDVLYDISKEQNFEELKQRVDKLKEGEFVIVKDRLRPNMKEYVDGKYTGRRYTESMMAAHSKEVMEHLDLKPSVKIPDTVGNMFGIRIPSQDNHSTVNIKIVDFMPAFYGSTIVSAAELVEVSGADFDIDKLYIQMKEYFFKDGKFNEYSGSFEDYARFVNKKVNEPGTTYFEARSKGDIRIDTPLDEAIGKEVKEGPISKASEVALRVLGLPLTKKQYDKYIKDTGRTPYSAVLNNQVLDHKWALMGNDSNTQFSEDQAAISYEPADIEVLKEVMREISAEIPELAEQMAEDEYDANNIAGQIRGFESNKEGAKSIGAAVLPNLYLSLLQETGINFKSQKIKGKETGPRLVFNGVVYNRFGNKTEDGTSSTREILATDKNGKPIEEGRRKQYIISALITAMTDNAKEQLADKLGLSINALSIATNMTALGVPIKTSILMLNHPVIRRGYYLQKVDPSFEGISNWLIKTVLPSLKGAVNTAGEYKIGETDINDDSLKDAIQNPFTLFDDKKDLEAYIKDDSEILETTDRAARDYDILKMFLTAHNISKFTKNLGAIMNLAKGFGKDNISLENVRDARKKLGLDLTDAQIKKLDFNKMPMMDLRKVFTKDRWQSKMLEIDQEFVENLLPKVFLDRSKGFEFIRDAAIEMFGGTFAVDDEFQAKIERDILSYITIKGYHELLR